MAGFWIHDPATPEGKFPVVLRRDGSRVDWPYFIINVHDPGFPDAMRAYALVHEAQGADWKYVGDCRTWAHAAETGAFGPPKRPSDPDAPRHRKDSEMFLLWARAPAAMGFDDLMHALGVSVVDVSDAIETWVAENEPPKEEAAR